VPLGELQENLRLGEGLPLTRCLSRRLCCLEAIACANFAAKHVKAGMEIEGGRDDDVLRALAAPISLTTDR
jgi:hypothetical protein